jgi:hypothetical protein
MSEEEVQSAEVAEEVSAAPVESEQAEAAAVASAEAAPVQEQGYSVTDLWGAFKSLPQFQGHDDRAVAAGLYESLQREQAASRALQQYQQIIPFASDYLSNREAFEQWKSSREQGQAAPVAAPRQPQPEESSWWNPPKIKDSYRQWLVRDENGREVIAENAPLEAKSALTEHLAYRADFAKKFLENPEQTLGPMVEKVAVQRAQAIVGEQIQRMRDEDFVTKLERENGDWLYDQSGNVSPEGLAVQKYIQDAKQLGIAGAQARWDFATKMVERDLMLASLRSQSAQQAQHQQAQPQAPQAAMQAAPQAPSPADATAQRNMEYLRQQAMRTASQRPAATTDARVPSKPMTFAEKLAANLQREGLI